MTASHRFAFGPGIVIANTIRECGTDGRLTRSHLLSASNEVERHMAPSPPPLPAAGLLGLAVGIYRDQSGIGAG